MEVFRNATESDIQKIAELEEKTFTDAWTNQNIYETFCQKQAFIIVAEVGDEIAGYCIIYYVMEEAEIARIAVGDKHRRKGIGRKLLDYTCACCKGKQVERLLLDVREGNTGARMFYQAYGFTEDGKRKDFYNNPKEDAVLMSRAIL